MEELLAEIKVLSHLAFAEKQQRWFMTGETTKSGRSVAVLTGTPGIAERLLASAVAEFMFKTGRSW